MSDVPWNDTALAANALYDLERYAEHSFIEKATTKEYRAAILRILRHSVRQYANTPLDDDTIRRVVRNTQACSHAEGLGACFLNWNVEKEFDVALRARVGIPDNALVITFMSAGFLKDTYAVPVSARKPLDRVLSLNPALAENETVSTT